MTTIRSPAVAGQFYAGSRDALHQQIESVFAHDVGPGSVSNAPASGTAIHGVVSPHAGYPYSGPVAAHGFARLAATEEPNVVVAVGPNHGRLGDPLAVTAASAWETPLGRVPIATTLRDRLVELTDLSVDERAHAKEHSIEVQVPFVQYLFEDVSLLPIVMSQQDRDSVDRLVAALSELPTADRSVVFIASTDLTHYEPASRAQKLDEPILAAIENLDADAVLDRIEAGHTMCGGGPTAAIMRTVSNCGASGGRVLQYATSGDTRGPTREVVGYVSATLE